MVWGFEAVTGLLEGLGLVRVLYKRVALYGFRVYERDYKLQ